MHQTHMPAVSSQGGPGEGFDVQKYGDGRVALIGAHDISHVCHKAMGCRAAGMVYCRGCMQHNSSGFFNAHLHAANDASVMLHSPDHQMSRSNVVQAAVMVA